MIRIARLGSLLALLVFTGCSQARAPTPGEVEAGAAGAQGLCTLLEGVTQNQTVISICATVEEIALIAAFVATLVRHGELADAGACTPLPGTIVCATKAELGQAIPLVLAKRRALFVSDAGAR